MNEQNIALVKKLYGAFAQGDRQTILNHLAANVEWRCEAPSEIPYAGIHYGPEQVTGFFQNLATYESDHMLRMEEYYCDADTVVSIGRYAAKVNATGKNFDIAVVHVFTIKDGNVTRFIDQLDTASLLRAYTA